ncbi:MAG: uroporphyrinogen-III synthase [Maricaulaceae bacterium]
MPRLWLTRTQPFADESAARLRSMGHEVCVAPLIETIERLLTSRLPGPEAVLIFTSRKAVAVFTRLISGRDWECICVGDATAEAARTAGFEHVHSAQGDASDVVAWVQKNTPIERPLYHASSAHPRGEIIERLQNAGFQKAHREIFYETKMIMGDPRNEPRADDIILLYSPMAAAALVSLDIDLQEMETISMSSAVNAALGSALCKERRIADKPTENSLFTQLP